MTEPLIPYDVKIQAEEVAAEWEMEAGPHRMLVASIASAIMWERKRCTEIANRYATDGLQPAAARLTAAYIRREIEQ
ncbi:hypothetical protein BFN67_04825 [Pseudaminobacter manganicus]|uniref:Uncharacterized protein n=1 Tax=Manganibacter manganicus TaxID=1873176 RepID=A0A1V8RP09_9HYPH|nr:hypothetical protein BFN67_04825 [Pseudaminobacter manganicus]